MSEKLDEVIKIIHETSSDVKFIKKELEGNGREGLIKRSDKHEGYFKMAAGGWFVIGVFWIIFQVIH